VAYFVLIKTLITTNAWKLQFPLIRMFAAEMLTNIFGPNKDELSK